MLGSDSRGPRDAAVLSKDRDDIMRPGVVVDPAEAEALGAFEETTREADDWEANRDIDHEVGHGE